MRFAAVALALCACTPLSVSHYRTAEPLGEGKQRVEVGLHIPKSGDTGTDEDQQNGNVDVDHAPLLFVNNIELAWRYGLGPKTELEALVFFPGGKVGLRHTFLEGERWKGAVGASAGVFGGSKPDGDAAGTWFDFPLTFSWHRDESLAALLGVTATRVNATRWAKERGRPHYERNVHMWQLGGFAGFSFGKDVRVLPGFTFYLEPHEYPISDFPAGAVYAYPWVGVSVDPNLLPALIPERPEATEDEAEEEDEEEEEES